MTQVDTKQTKLPYDADKVVPTICGCGDACGMNHLAQAYVKDGKIVHYEGCKEAPNKGALCARGAAGIDIVNDPNRIKYPMKRTNAKGEKGEFQRISWDEAYDTIATAVAKAIQEVGSHAINLQFGHPGDFGLLANLPAMTSRFGFDSAVRPHRLLERPDYWRLGHSGRLLPLACCRSRKHQSDHNLGREHGRHQAL